MADTYSYNVLCLLDKKLVAEGNSCQEIEGGFIVTINLEGEESNTSVLVLNNDDYLTVLCACPLRDDETIVNSAVELICELDTELLKNVPDYEGCHVVNYQNIGVNISKNISLSSNEEFDVERAFKAILNVCSLKISFYNTMKKRINSYVYESVSEHTHCNNNDWQMLQNNLEKEKRKNLLALWGWIFGVAALIVLMVIMYATDGFGATDWG